jgi:hypothetical protein
LWRVCVAVLCDPFGHGKHDDVRLIDKITKLATHRNKMLILTTCFVWALARAAKPKIRAMSDVELHANNEDDRGSVTTVSESESNDVPLPFRRTESGRPINGRW